MIEVIYKEEKQEAKNGEISIFYSTRHIAKAFENKDTANVDFETRGVLLHELTHAYQLEPQGIGSYGTNKVFWAFIEGMADAVRIANGGFHGENDRPKGGNYMDGYRCAGYFFVWLPVLVRPETILYQEWTASFTDSPVSMMTFTRSWKRF